MNTATIADLAYLIKQAKDERLPKPIVFLGAGASKTGGVPLAGEIVTDILDKYKEVPKIKHLKDEDKNYPTLMSCITAFERNKLLKGYIDKAKINVTHIYLAQLIVNEYVDYVLTVNFDNLMLRALALFNEFPPTYDMAILKDLTTTNFREKSVVYLHGQHHGLWLLNTKEEMAKVNEMIPPILNSIKNQRPWIFIGYSGEDPIFEHIVKLGRFDNGLYWVGYNENTPCDKVCNQLLDKDNTNAYIIKGYDADSFMLKLTAELGLQQPSIIDKPFSSLKDTLENIVDIDDKEHFKGVKERLEIVKRDVGVAIEQFEEGKSGIKIDEIDIGRFKKQLIDKQIAGNFDEKEIQGLEEETLNFKNPEINNLMAELFVSWGLEIYNLALSQNDEKLYKQSIEKFEKAIKLNPKYDWAFNNWASALYNLAIHKRDEDLFKQSIEKYGEAININSKNDSAFYNFGNTLFELGKLKKDENLFKQSFEKFEKAIEINHKKDNAFSSWGNALLELAKLKKDENLFKQSFEKFEKAIELNSKNDLAFSNYGASLLELADLKKDEGLFKQSIEKFLKAIELNHKNNIAFSNWGNALSRLAKLKNDQNLLIQSFEKYEKAIELNPKNQITFSNWGEALLRLAKLKNDQNLITQSFEKLNKAIELGGRTYNLACLYAITNDKKNALLILEKSLNNKEITTDFVKNDDDWKEFLNDEEFIKILEKYS